MLSISSNVSQLLNLKEACSNKDKKKQVLKIAGAGSAGAVAVGITYAVKKNQVTNIKNIRDTFQRVFLRDNISIEEAKDILHKYKEIEKIKDKVEYTKSLFNEAKKNFGLEKSNIKLEFEKKPKAAGSCRNDNAIITVSPSTPRERLMNTIHHEFRHVKQNYWGACLDHDRASYVAMRCNMDVAPDIEFKKLFTEKRISFERNVNGCDMYKTDDGTFSQTDLIQHYKKKYPEDDKKLSAFAMAHWTNVMGEPISPDKIPPQYSEYAKKCKEGLQNYSSATLKLYWENFAEKDARKTGRLMDKFVRAKAFTYYWFTDLRVKLKTTLFPNTR